MSGNSTTHLPEYTDITPRGESLEQCLYLYERSSMTSEGIRCYVDKVNPEQFRAYLFPEESDLMADIISMIDIIRSHVPDTHVFVVRLTPEPLTVQRELYLTERPDP